MGIRQQVTWTCDYCPAETPDPVSGTWLSVYEPGPALAEPSLPTGWVRLTTANGATLHVCPAHKVLVDGREVR